MCPGMMPIFAFPGEMTPGQFGPMRRLPLRETTRITSTMSRAGIPSVIQTTRGIPRIDGFEDRIGGEGRRHEDHRGVGAGPGHRVAHGIEDRNAFDGLPRFAGGDAGDDLGPVVDRASRVELPFVAGDSLDEEAGIVSNEDAHFAPLAAATTLAAASCMLSAVMKLRPDSAEHFLPDVDVGPLGADHDGHFHVELLHRADDALPRAGRREGCRRRY